MSRNDGRRPDDLPPLELVPDFLEQPQGSKTPFSRARLDELLEFAAVGIEELAAAQEESVAAARV